MIFRPRHARGTAATAALIGTLDAGPTGPDVKPWSAGQVFVLTYALMWACFNLVAVTDSHYAPLGARWCCWHLRSSLMALC